MSERRGARFGFWPVIAGLGTAAAVGSVLSIRFLPVPFMFAFAAWAAACLLAMLAATGPGRRALLFNLAFVAGLLAALEAAAYVHARRNYAEPTYSPEYRRPDPELGRAPARGVAVRSTRVRQGSLQYDVVYTINQDGLRVTPPATVAQPRGCVLFFGCSFTFGEGLNDGDTLPFRVGSLTGGSFQVYNFGYHGYGAHQMLAALESDRVRRLSRCEPTHVVYQAIPDHVARAAGLYPWTIYDPRYVLAADGSVVRRGSFNDGERPMGPVETAVALALRESFLTQWLGQQMAARPRPLTPEDVRLWVGVVAASRRQVERQFPDAEFHVVLWPWSPQRDTYDAMRGSLAAAGVTTHLVSDILPAYERDPVPYQIDAADAHPNARANGALAEFVADRILRHDGGTP